MKKKLKVAVLIHKGLLPPDNASRIKKEDLEDFKVEYHVISTLIKTGHSIYPVEMFGELEPLRTLIDEIKPDIAFNLLEEFTEFPLFDQQVINYLEMKKIPYTGCNPRGMMLAKDKALSKKILAFHNINIPRFEVFPLNKKISIKDGLRFPLFVKSLNDEGSIGISKESIVDSEEKLINRIEYLHESFATDVIAEEFIEGREIYVGVLGNTRLKILTPWELVLKNDSSDTPIATSRLKWNVKHQKQAGLYTGAAKLSPVLKKKFQKITREIYTALKLSGYARIDYRLTPDEEIYLLEANPNPFLASDEDLAASAKYDGIEYSELLEMIIRYGSNYNPFGK
jgi:D-alanine-D-alanine ligase